MPRGITQNGEAIPVLGLADLTPREACGQYLLRRRRLLLRLPVAKTNTTKATMPATTSAQNKTMPIPMPAYPHQPMSWSYQNIMITAPACAAAIVVVTAELPQSRNTRLRSLCVGDY